MKQDIKKIILTRISRKGKARVAEIVKATDFSRAYVNRFFQELKKEGRLVLIGKANNAFYVPADKAVSEKKKILAARRILKNSNLSEDLVLEDIRQGSGIFFGLPRNLAGLLEYAFTEMLNNAIEHSKSKRIVVLMNRTSRAVFFEVIDFGMGIFRNIRDKKGLNSQIEAIQDLLKGKETTMPEAHSGEGIFFTSKIADNFIIQSSDKKVVFDNLVKDVFVKDSSRVRGTKIFFEVSLKSKKKLEDIFGEYSQKGFDFGKTKVRVNLFSLDNVYISRSQARRIMAGMEKFRTITLDFKGVETVGQGFADEVFRVWKKRHPGIKIEYQNAKEGVLIMIKRALQ
jgi:anti-sigma regulatory factor (Ser/Thr protein kinase)